MATVPVPAQNGQHYLVILCGGTGPRLWPLSTANKPKQFLTFFDDQNLLEATVARAKKIVPRKNIFIVSNIRYKNRINKLRLPVPLQNILYEPEKRNTLMAIVYAASLIKKIDPLAVITTLPADHYIKKLLHFKKDIRQAAYIAKNQGAIVTIGIKPTGPNPAYGYIKTQPSTNVFKEVVKFKEKPSVDEAKKYLKSRRYYWNSGIYTFSLRALTDSLVLFEPDFYQAYLKLRNNNMKSFYHRLPSKAFDYAISEKSKNLLCIKASFIWSDVGEWKSIFQILQNKSKLASLTKTPQITIDSNNCLTSGLNNKIVALVGVSNLAVIDTPFGLLVCDLNHSYQVRELIATMVADPETKKYFLSK